MVVSEGRLLWERLDVDNRADAATVRRQQRRQSAVAVRPGPRTLRSLCATALVRVSLRRARLPCCG